MIELDGHKQQLGLQQTEALISEASARRLRLRRATREFEALFIAQILKNMRSASFKQEQDGFGKDVMLQMADESVSRQLAATGMLGIGDLLFERLAERLDGDALPTDQFPAADRISVRRPGADRLGGLQQFRNEIISAARATGLSPSLIEAVIMEESAGDPRAVSPKGARGLMQLMPDTAAELGVRDAYDPQQNVLAGARYLKSLLRRFGNLRLALAAYNSGPQTVERYGGLPPYAETVKYVNRIITNLKEAK